ncbi:MAG: TonB-dependent receptor plug domain-containing protein [Melioribacteraceae bacterium]
MKHFYSFLTIYLLLQFIVSAQQSDSVKTIFKEIVVTATKTETPYYAIGSSVSIITSNQISERHLQTVVDILREVPGLSVIEQGGPGKLSNVFIRGANSNHTLVVVDGITMNDASSPNNAFDFSSLNSNDIDRIEIVRGPQSTLYGSDAIAGIINIITKQGSDKPHYSFSTYGGSNNYYKGNLSALGTFGILRYAINASRGGSDGVSASDSKFGNLEKDGNRNNSFTSRFDLVMNQNTKFDLIYKFTKMETSLDQSEKFGDDPNYTYNIEEQLFKAGFIASLFNNNWQQQLSVSLMKQFSHSIDLKDLMHPDLSSDSYNKAQRVKLDWQNNLHFIENNLITFGIESETETARTSYYSTSEWGPFNSVFPEQSIRTTGIYLQDQINIANSFFTTVGLRYDNNQRFGNVTTFRIAPAFLINSTGTKLRMSYGSGFKAPSLFYLFDPAFGNPNLQPEKSNGWDLGIDQSFESGQYNFGITYFNLVLDNMFGFDSNFRTVNIAKASSRGIEFTASIINVRDFSLSANYTFTETKDDYELSPDYNKPLLRRPKQQANFDINYRVNDKTSFNFQLHYVGKRDDKDFSTFPASRVSIPDYTLVNIASSYKLFDYLELTARIENLFNKQYEEALYYGTLGRSFYAGVKFDF